MAPKRAKRKNAAVKNNSTITKFFALSTPVADTHEPQTTRIGLPRCESAASSLNLNETEAGADVDEVVATAVCPKPALLEPLSPVEVLDSDSDSDSELVDADSILGVKTIVRPPPMSIKQRAKHRNTLKALVRETESRKYNYSFLEQHAHRESSDNDDDDDDDKEGSHKSASDDEDFARDVLGDDMARIRLQMGRHGQTQQRERMALQIAVFSGPSGGTQPLDMAIKVPRLARLQAVGGRLLTATTGDEIVHGMCLAKDQHVATECYAALIYALDMGISEWALEPRILYTLLERLVGTLTDRGADAESSDSGNSTPSVYVEIVRTRPPDERLMRSCFERVAWLLDVASRAVGAVETEDYAQIVALYAYCLADQHVSASAVGIQKSLATFVCSIQPASRWTQVLSESVTRIARHFAPLLMRAQLQIVESLPVGSQRCIQLSQVLALSFLSMQVDPTRPSSQGAEVHPVVAAAGLVEEGLLAVVSCPDFELLEARVCLLGRALTGVSVLRERPDSTKAVRTQLSVLNRRISDSIIDGMSKTLAKDAVQILISRIDMITSSTSAHHQTNIIYGSSSKTLATTAALGRHLQKTKLQ
ncbi:hypothetical protein GGI15_003654 [Coemansia interrupta]|uniref:Uncharacterized protein n=1 Tax=Coemansia interrupta TaxID=1126814 RepID=A0A9W8HD51_9FUNG|nr:hypothetical protein GGI15_003654 [Coemansia interrupta]